MSGDYEVLRGSLVTIASEMFRFEGVFAKVVGKLEEDERKKYVSQFAWFSKRVLRALEDAGLRIVSLDGQLYDPGMAVTPVNLEDFETDDVLYVERTVEPIIMENDTVVRTGTVLLGRKPQ